MKLRITVEGKVYEVDVEVLEEEADSAAPAAPRVAAPAAAPALVAAAPVASPSPPPAAAPTSSGAKLFPSPMAGTIRSIHVKPGDAVRENQDMFTLEAMKMETAVSAPGDATIKTVLVNPGDRVQAGQALVEFA